MTSLLSMQKVRFFILSSKCDFWESEQINNCTHICEGLPYWLYECL